MVMSKEGINIDASDKMNPIFFHSLHQCHKVQICGETLNTKLVQNILLSELIPLQLRLWARWFIWSTGSLRCGFLSRILQCNQRRFKTPHTEREKNFHHWLPGLHQRVSKNNCLPHATTFSEGSGELLPTCPLTPNFYFRILHSDWSCHCNAKIVLNCVRF